MDESKSEYSDDENLDLPEGNDKLQESDDKYTGSDKSEEDNDESKGSSSKLDDNDDEHKGSDALQDNEQNEPGDSALAQNTASRRKRADEASALFDLLTIPVYGKRQRKPVNKNSYCS